MSIATILKQHGLVPAVPSPSEILGAAPAFTCRRVPMVPAVPHKNSKGETATAAIPGRKADLLALHGMRDRLYILADRIGVPRVLVDALSAEELEATVEQVALVGDHLDGNGNPLAHSLLMFYLRCLAERV